MNLQKTKDILSLAVTALSAVPTLIELGKKIAPEVKKALSPVFDGYKKLSTKPETNSTTEVEKIEQA